MNTSLSKRAQRAKERQLIVHALLSRIETLVAELRIFTDVKRREEIESELRHLRRKQRSLSVKKGKRKKTVTPIPQSYVDQRKKTREDAARISGRKITVVQGGAPGSGRRR
jgi:hypothetical protein